MLAFSFTWADEVSAKSGPEVVEDSVPMGLSHPSVNIVATVTELSNLLGQELHALSRIAENDTLVDLTW